MEKQERKRGRDRGKRRKDGEGVVWSYNGRKGEQYGQGREKIKRMWSNKERKEE